MRYKIICILLAIILLAAGCSLPSNTDDPTSSVATSSPTPQAIPKKVGILFPNSSHFWNRSGLRLQQQLEANGGIADLQYANDSLEVQESQLEKMIAKDYDVIVIAPVDSVAMEEVLFQAKEKDIPVIAYARYFFSEPEAITYSAVFDRDNIGIQFGEYIEETLDLKNAPGPFNIELFSGDSGDSMPYSHFQHNGLIEFLQPYFDNGKLTVSSKQFWEFASESFNTEEAYECMKELIASKNYGSEPQKTRLDAVICINDLTAQGVTRALLEAGYTADNFPIITGGMDTDIESVKNIIAGTQSMSIVYDPTILADRVAQMITSILNGEKPETNDTEIYGQPIPTYLCDPVVVTRENYREVLIDSGYYTEEELNG